jgi:hypothetical protein
MTTTTAAQLVKLTKQNKSRYSGARLYVCKVNEDTWYTESHFAVRRDPGRHSEALAQALSKYNLDIEPGTYEVNGTITRAESDPPNLGPILAGIDDKYRSVERSTIASGCPVYTRAGDQWLALFDLGDSEYVAVRVDYLDYCADAAAVAEWHAKDSLKSVAGYNADGELVAVIMAYRV